MGTHSSEPKWAKSSQVAALMSPIEAPKTVATVGKASGLSQNWPITKEMPEGIYLLSSIFFLENANRSFGCMVPYRYAFLCYRRARSSLTQRNY